MVYNILLEDLDGNTKTLQDQQNLELVREHTALSDWRADLPINLELENWRFSEIKVTEDGDQKFRGFLEVINTQEQQSRTSISGRGIGKHLIDGETTVTYELIEAVEAIKDYWDEHTPFTATVTEPEVQGVVDDRLIAALTSTEQLDDQVEIEETDPVKVEGDQIDLLQSNFVRDPRFWSDQDALHDVLDPGERSQFSNGSGVVFKRSGGFVEVEFTPLYTIPEDHVSLAVRERIRSGSGESPTISYQVDGNEVAEKRRSSSRSTEWRHYTDYSGGDLKAGETVTVRLEATETGRKLQEVDLISLYDDRYDYTWDNSVDQNQALGGPELLPDSHTVSLGEIDAGLNVNTARMEVLMLDTSGDQSLGLGLQTGGLQTENNTQDIEVDFSNTDGILVEPQVTLSRYGTRSDTTPKRGFRGQSVSSIKIYVDGDDKRLISSEEFSGNHLENLQTLHSRANMRFTIDHTEPDDLLAESYPAGEEETPEWRVKQKNRKVDVKGYANRVKVRGAKREDGTRPVVIKENQGEIDRLNGTTISYSITDPKIDNLTDTDARAEAEIRDRSTVDRLQGSITVVGGLPEPGKEYYIEDWDLTLPIQKVTYSEGEGSLQADIDFDEPESLGVELSTVKKTGRRREEAI